MIATSKAHSVKPLRDFSEKEKSKLFAMIDSSAGPSGCWPINKKLNTHGYGQIMFSRVLYGTHRVVLHLTSPCPYADALALHSCDNRNCHNPSHLRWGTVLDNATDRESRGRRGVMDPRKARFAINPELTRGAQNPMAKLSSADVGSIRRLYASGNYSQGDLRKAFNVNQSTISRIINQLRWQHE